MSRPSARPARLAVAGLLAAAAALPLQAQEDERPLRLPGLRAQGPVTYADVLEPALEAVVHVQAQRRVTSGFIPFFGGQDDSGRERESQGSGVIVRPDGTILTNSHVVEGADRVIVKLQDRRELVAKIVGTDPASDVAVLKLDVPGTRWPALPFGSSSHLRIGDVVFALGSPLGLDQTATMGIVSAKGREGLGITRYDHLIQTDAAINPGNSGGAMINARGELVGINTAILYRGTPSYQGVGLAIPIDLARGIMNQLLTEGRVVRAFLGVQLDDIDAELARRFGMDRPRGAAVSRVVRDTPAADAGLRVGDVILAVDEDEVDTLGELRLAISGRRPGDRVKLRVLRDGGERTLTARLTTLEEEDEAESRPRPPMVPEMEWGLRLQELDERLRERLGVETDLEGAVVAGVRPGSPAEKEGLAEGDVIVRVERERVRGVAEARRLIEGAEGDTLLLLVRRGDETRFVVLER